MKTPVSPKVTSGATWAALITLGLNAITPDMLAPLGKYQGLAEAALAILAFAVGAWRKDDPLRTAGAKAAAKAVADEVPGIDPDAVQKILAAVGAKLAPADPVVNVSAAPAVDPVTVAKAIPAVAAQIDKPAA